MSERTNIQWCDSTRNFWTGCTKIGPGCDGCYAEAFHRRINGGRNWGPGAPRIPHLDGAARDLRRWNRRAEREIESGKRQRCTVFLNSHSDFFDNEVPPAWRDFAWSVIRECRFLTFIIVTKRIGNALAMLPADWGDGWANVWLLATVCDQAEADRDLPKLLRTPARVRGLSVEPLLGPVDLVEAMGMREPGSRYNGWADLDWVIVGGESDQRGHKARPCDVKHIRSILAQCRAAGVACFVKQIGAHALASDCDDDFGGQHEADGREWPDPIWWDCAHDGQPPSGSRMRLSFRNRSGGDADEWPEALRVREFPADESALMGD